MHLPDESERRKDKRARSGMATGIPSPDASVDMYRTISVARGRKSSAPGSGSPSLSLLLRVVSEVAGQERALDAVVSRRLARTTLRFFPASAYIDLGSMASLLARSGDPETGR